MNRAFFSFVLLFALLVPCLAQTASPTPAPHLLTGRYGMPAVVIGNSIAAVGGSGPNGLLHDIEKVDFADGRVTDIETALLPRRYHTAQVSGPYLYVIGGVANGDSTRHMTNVVERCDLRTGAVKQMSPLPTPRRMVNSVLWQGKVYVVGGSTVGDTVHTGKMEIYDIRTDRWTEGPPMPTPRECPVVIRDGVLYAVAGYDGHAATRTFEAYSIARHVWYTLPDLPFAMSAHHMATSGEWLFTFGDYVQLDRVSAYNFRTGEWKLLTGTGYSPSRHNAVVAANGCVYVLGGNVASFGSHLSSIQNGPLQTLSLRALEQQATAR